MKLKIGILAGVLLAAVCFTLAAAADEAEAVRAELAIQVQRMLDAGHLKPFSAQRGEDTPEIYFTNPGDTVWALSRAYPYLPDKMKPLVKAYLEKEMADYPPCSDKISRPTDPGAYRHLHELPRDDFAWVYDGRKYKGLPRLHNIHAVRLYAENTGDWDYVKNNWNAVEAFYAKHSKEAGLYAGGAAGAIAMSRIARKLGKDDVAGKADGDAKNALKAFENESEMASKAAVPYRGDREKWEKAFHHYGYHYLYMTPDVGRYLREDPRLKEMVCKRTAEGVLHWPMWHISQATAFMRYYGEGHALPPLLSAMIWPVKVHVEETPADRLRVLMDAEDAYIGDLFFINKIVDVIEAY